MSTSDSYPRDSFGPNDWLIEDMFESYSKDPASVSDGWQEFFKSYVPNISRAATVVSSRDLLDTTQQAETNEEDTARTTAKETATQETATQETATQETVTQETVTQETVTQETVTQEIVTQEIVTQEIEKRTSQPLKGWRPMGRGGNGNGAVSPSVPKTLTQPSPPESSNSAQPLVFEQKPGVEPRGEPRGEIVESVESDEESMVPPEEIEDMALLVLPADLESVESVESVAEVAVSPLPPVAEEILPQTLSSELESKTSVEGAVELGSSAHGHEAHKEEGESEEGDHAIALRGVPAAVALNMTTSLSVPTATSFRTIAAKLLEVNRTIVNNQAMRSGGKKISFTHIIAFAVVKALGEVKVLNSAYVADCDGKGTPGVVHHSQINLGVAVDIEKPDGSRALYVPVLRSVAQMSFTQFVNAYDSAIAKVRLGKLRPDDLVGATVTLTNPGTIGTEMSVPRLMVGQGAIVGVGSLGYPVELSSADPKVLSGLGVSKTVTLTSTYDHRIIQGAESGLFLAKIAEYLIGGESFYDEIFSALEVPYPPIRWLKDENSAFPLHESAAVVKQVHVQTLINNYRVRGHLIADLDPLRVKKPIMPVELDPATFDLTVWDLEREFYTDGLAKRDRMTLSDILGTLRDAYCRTVGIEYMHIQIPEEKHWIQSQVEGRGDLLTADEKMYLLGKLNAAESFERFLHTRYIGQKRFGLEGAESAIAFIDEVLTQAAQAHLEEAVLGMAHRGRLNVLANIVGKSFAEVFKEFEGNLDPASVQGSGDVKYHKGFAGIFKGRGEEEIDVYLSSNPSHLEAVGPVVEGLTRAKQDIQGSPYAFPVLALLIHGDAAFAGQGVVGETLNLSQLRGYRTGGTVHLVINNQLGFTTNPDEARSSLYATDVAKTVQAPIFHVNGDDPEAVVKVARLAFGYRQRFHKDVVVDMICYRRFGHNEGDEPSYTQPQMYEIIERRPSVRKIYTEALIRRGELSAREADDVLDDFLKRLQSALDQTRSATAPSPLTLPPAPPSNIPLEVIPTGYDKAALDYVSSCIHSWPEGFVVHPKLQRQLGQRDLLYASGEIDWALGELLAFGSILLDGRDIRFAGQDSRRGTFSHRHAALVDYRTGELHMPLASLRDYQGDHLRADRAGRFMIYDSSLSEYAALGFEYGYSLAQTEALVCWEAQFGDFANGAQIIIDQFLVAAEDKWGQHSGLVLLLPHGYEGQGAEHSSARIERFLQLAAGSNISIANPTTAAQYFHLLRSQVNRVPKRPLVVATPKSLLRAKQARSSISEVLAGSFDPVLDDPFILGNGDGLLEPGEVSRILLCSGKIAYEALARRLSVVEGKRNGEAVAVVRVEQLYPWPKEYLDGIFSKYSNASEVVWLQEEPENMGVWPFAHRQLHAAIADRFHLRSVCRVAAGSPATGFAGMHALEQEDLLVRAIDQVIN